MDTDIFPIPICHNTTDITPDQYERQVISWLQQEGRNYHSFTIKNLAKDTGSGGDYSLDGLAEFEIFSGAKIKVLIECKRHQRPLSRDTILAVKAKKDDISAEKALVFSTSGFQKGAVTFAKNTGIALIQFANGESTYFTRSAEKGCRGAPPGSTPEFAGWSIEHNGDNTRISIITNGSTATITRFISNSQSNYTPLSTSSPA